MTSDLTRAAAYLRGKAAELRRMADGYDPLAQRESAHDLCREAAEADAAADLLAATQECEDHADTDLPAALWLPMAKRRRDAAHALAAHYLGSQP